MELNAAEIELYQQNGFLKKYVNFQEIELLYSLSVDDTVKNNSMDFLDREGKKTKLTLWFTSGDDSFGLMSRFERVVHSH